ncbi:MAG: hydroxymethylbilane synthase [Coriobacteriia bacterium]
MAARSKLVIGTRGSKLALWQAEYIGELVEQACGLPVEIRIIKTTGDKILDVPLAKVGSKGLFTKEIEVELLAGTVDLAVHSMKDVPTELPEGLEIAAMPPRVDARDVVVARADGGTAAPTAPGAPDALAPAASAASAATSADGLLALPEGARVGTSSLRRISQLRALRPDVEIVDVRGNLDTRMRKAETGELDAVILAAAGITRMGWAERITRYLPAEQMVSAVGQGAIGVEIRSDDELLRGICEQIVDAATMMCVTAERVVMRRLEGGCQVPIGAHAEILGGGLMAMDAFVGRVDGSLCVRAHVEGLAEEPVALGEEMVAKLLELGVGAILEEVRAAAQVDGLLET